MRYSQIKKKYPRQWVIMEVIKKDPLGIDPSGKVLVRGKDRNGVMKKLVKFRGKPLGFFYTGPLPKKLAVLICESIFERASWSFGD